MEWVGWIGIELGYIVSPGEKSGEQWGGKGVECVERSRGKKAENWAGIKKSKGMNA